MRGGREDGDRVRQVRGSCIVLDQKHTSATRLGLDLPNGPEKRLEKRKTTFYDRLRVRAAATAKGKGF